MKQLVIGLLACGFAAFALAQPAAAGTAGGGGATFECGGIGQGEQERFKREAARHHALLSFSTPGGAYLADVAVQVAAPDGKVILEGTCAGPLMLLDVPAAGRYRITASFSGRQQQKLLRLGDKPARVSFVWKDR